MKKRPPSKRPAPPRVGDKPAAIDPAPREEASFITRERIERLPDVLLGGVTALLVATPLIPSEATSEGVETTLNVLWLLLLLAWSVGLLLRKGQTFRFGWTDAAFAGLIGWHVISGLVMGPQGNGRQTLNVVWQWVVYGVIYLLLRQLTLSQRQQRAVAAVMVGLGVALTAHAYYQYFYSGEIMREAFQRNPDKVFAENAWPIDGASPIRSLIENRVFSTEPLATFALTNSLAGYLAPWLIFVAGLALLAVSSARYRLLAATSGIALFIAGVLFLTKSRTAILATAACIFLLLLYGPRRGWRIDWKAPTAIVAVAVLIGLGAVLVGGLDIEVLSQAPLSVRYRLEYWRSTAAMIADYPLFGCGPGNYQEYYTHYKLPQASETIKDPHNFIFEIWSNAGTPALLMLLAMAGAFIYEQRGGDRGGADEADDSGDEPGHEADAPSSTELSASAAERDSAPTATEGKGSLRWIMGGAALGVVLSFPIGVISGYPPEPSLIPLPLAFGPPVPIVLGLPLGALAIWMLRGWIRGGRMPVSILVIALLCLLINLLAAGATTFPGVINTAWVLIALALAGTQTWKPIPLETRSSVAALGVSAAILVVFLFTVYRPVLNSKTYLSTGEVLYQQNDLIGAERSFAQAAEADPWASEPWQKLLDVRLKTWYENQTPENWRRYEQIAERYMASDPQFYGVYESVAVSTMSAAGVNPSPERRARVVDLLRRAVELYPSGAMIRAQYAWALYRAGKTEEAAQEAAEALRLDSLHNHTEQKLKSLRIYDPSQPDVDPKGLRPETAEQSMKNLRNASGRLRP